MDQDSFRQLLSAPRSAALAKPAPASKSKTKTVDASQPIFAPRKAKADSGTSHAPRRAGIGHKGPARDAEPSTSSFVPDPTIEPPPKFSLDLEAIELARNTASEKDVDELLEQTYRSKQAGGEASASSASTATSSKKRTREEIVAELKNKRLKTNSGDAEKATPPEPAAAALSSKFKPIGAPKTNPKAESKAKKEKKKKKDTAAAEPSSATAPAKGVAAPVPSLGAAAKKPAPPPPEDDDIDPDADLFAGVGDYDGFGDDDDEDYDTTTTAGPSKPSDAAPPATSADIGPGRWFKMDDEPSLPTAAPQHPATAHAARSRSTSPSAVDPAQSSSSAQTVEAPMQTLRLEALASSSISIRDVLDMDKQLEKEQLRLARKAKNKRGAGDEAVASAVQGKGRRGGEKQKMSAEAKAHQDFQKLQAFERKRGTG